MARQRIDDPDALAAGRLAWEHGATWRAAALATNGRMTMSTLRSRGIEEGWKRSSDGTAATEPIEVRRVQAEHRKIEVSRKVSERRELLSVLLLDDVLQMRKQLFEPYEHIEIKVVSGPTGMGSDVEIVRVELPRPTPADQLKISNALAILTDKLLLLSGEATVRSETIVDRESVLERTRYLRDELAERRAQAAVVPEEILETG